MPRWSFLLGLALFPGLAWSQAETDEPLGVIPLPDPVPELPTPREPPRPCDQVYVEPDYIDSTRETLEETLCGAALWLDGVLGESGDVLAARRSRGRLEVSHTWSEFRGNKTRVRLNVRVELPALKRRLSAFVGRGDDEEFVRGRQEGFELRSEFPNLDDDDDWLLGLGYRFPSSKTFSSNFRIGARRLTDTEFFAQQRFGYLAYADFNDALTFREILFWTNHDGFGSTTGADYMHVLTPTLLARWDTVATVTEKASGVDWRSAAILYQNLGRLRGLAYEAFVRGRTGRPEPLAEYGARLILRHPIFRRRLFVELIAGYTWPRDDPALPREGSSLAGIGLELPFGPQR